MIVRIRFCWTDEGHKNHTKKAKMIEKCDKKKPQKLTLFLTSENIKREFRFITTQKIC